MLDILYQLYDIAVFIYNFLFSGIFELISWLLVILTSFLMIIFYKISILMMSATWDIVSIILTELDVSGMISAAWGQLDSTFMPYLSFFKIPEAFNNILSAFATRLAMRLSMPWY